MKGLPSYPLHYSTPLGCTHVSSLIAAQDLRYLILPSQTPTLAHYVLSWSTDLPSTSSDHIPITVLLTSPLLRTPPTSPDWERSHWSIITPAIHSLSLPLLPSLPTVQSLTQCFDRHIGTLTAVLNNNTPLKRPTLHSKPWWSQTLAHLRQSYHHLNRSHKQSSTSSSSGDNKAAKNQYFKGIKKAKADHGNAFLVGVNSPTVWTAKRLAYGRPPDSFLSFEGKPSPEQITPLSFNISFPLKISHRHHLYSGPSEMSSY